jgi:PKD repeat protein
MKVIQARPWRPAYVLLLPLVIIGIAAFALRSHSAAQGATVTDQGDPYVVMWRLEYEAKNSFSQAADPDRNIDASSSSDLLNASYTGKAEVRLVDEEGLVTRQDKVEVESNYDNVSHATWSRVNADLFCPDGWGLSNTFDRRITTTDSKQYFNDPNPPRLIILQFINMPNGSKAMLYPLRDDPRIWDLNGVDRSVTTLCGGGVNDATTPFDSSWPGDYYWREQLAPAGFRKELTPENNGQRYVLRHEVFRDHGNGFTQRYKAEIIVEPQNARPEVKAGAPLEGKVGDDVQLSGVAKDDGKPIPPGTLATTWTVDSAPVGGSVNFLDPHKLDTTARFSKPGDYVLKLTANDGQLEASDTIAVKIAGKPVADFSFIVNSGGQVEFDAGSSKPAGTTTPIVKYAWKFDDGTPDATSNKPAMPHYYDYHDIFKPFKVYKVSLTVTDSAGEESDPVEKQVNVCAPDTPPGTAQDYAGIVRCVEIALPGQSPREILTTMRTLHYGNQPWSQVRTPRWDRIIPCGLPVADPRPSLDPKLLAAIRTASSQNTVLEGDMSHVFTGLEAMQCPSESVGFEPSVANMPLGTWIVGMPNYFIATWGGDIASAAGQKAADDFPLVQHDWSHYIGPMGIRANYSDLLVDVDGLVLNFMIGGQTCSERFSSAPIIVPLSQSLRTYYPDFRDPFAQKSDYRNRVACFADLLGVKLDRKVDKSKLTSRYSSMVEEFALPYYYLVQSTSNVAADDRVRPRVSTYSQEVTDIFADWLNSLR